MRWYFLTMLAVLALGVESASAQIWYPRGVYTYQYRIAPYWSAPVVYNYYPTPILPGYAIQQAYTFSSPYGYRQYGNYGYTTSPYGGTYYSNVGVSVRPYVVGPMHSVYFDPWANTYRYTSGPTVGNQTFFYRYGYGY